MSTTGQPRTIGTVGDAGVVEPKSARAHPSGPYVGPKPFGAEDAGRFFGREREAHELAAMVQAHPIVVLYSQSGAGKTSLLNARLEPMLKSKGAIVHAGVRTGQRVPGMEAAANVFTFNALTHLKGRTPGRDETLADFIDEAPALREDGRPARLRVIVLDQFEEMFTLLPEHWQQRREFFRQIGRTLDTDDLHERLTRVRRLTAWCDRRAARLEAAGREAAPTKSLRSRLAGEAARCARAIERADNLRYVIALREEFIAELDPLACHVPERLGARYRLERLREDAALEAIEKPLIGTGVSYADGAARLLVENLRKSSSMTVAGTIDASDEFVEPVHLQVVCESLWRNFGQAHGVITKQDVLTCGNIDEALSSYFEQSIARVARQPDWGVPQLRRWFACELIRDGRRVLVMQAGQAVAGLQAGLANQLAGLQLLRAVPRAGVTYFEITHDRFVRPIQQAYEQWREEMRSKNPDLAEWESRAAAWAASGRTGGAMLPPNALAAARAWLNSDEARTLTPSEELRAFIIAGSSARAAFEAARPDIAHAEEAAAAWEREGRPRLLLLSRDQLGMIEEWTASPEAERVGYTPALKALEAASRAALNDLEQRLPELVRLEGRAKQWVKADRHESEHLTYEQLLEAERIERDEDAASIGLSAVAKELIAVSREAREEIERTVPMVQVWEQKAQSWHAAGRTRDHLARGRELEQLSSWVATPAARGLGATRLMVAWETASRQHIEALQAKHPDAAYWATKALEWDRKGRNFRDLIPIKHVARANRWLGEDDARELGVADITRDYIVASATWAKFGVSFGFFVLLCVGLIAWLGYSRYESKAEAVRQARIAEAKAVETAKANQEAALAGGRIRNMVQRLSNDRAAKAVQVLNEGGNPYEALASALLSVADPILGDDAPPESEKVLRLAYESIVGPTPLRDLGGEEPLSVHVSVGGTYGMVVCPRGLYIYECKTGRRMGEPVRPSSAQLRWVRAHFTPDDGVVLAVEAPLIVGRSSWSGDAPAANAPMVQQMPNMAAQAAPSIDPGKERRLDTARIRRIRISPTDLARADYGKGDPGRAAPVRGIDIFDPGVADAEMLGASVDMKFCFAVLGEEVRLWPDWPKSRFVILHDETGMARFPESGVRVLIAPTGALVATMALGRGVEIWTSDGMFKARLEPDIARRSEHILPTVMWMPDGEALFCIIPAPDGFTPDRFVVCDASSGRVVIEREATIKVETVSIINGGKAAAVIGRLSAAERVALTVGTDTLKPLAPPAPIPVTELIGTRVLIDGRPIAIGARILNGGEPFAAAEVVPVPGQSGVPLLPAEFAGVCLSADTDSHLKYTMCIRALSDFDGAEAFLWDRKPEQGPTDLSNREALVQAACRIINTQPERVQVEEILRLRLVEAQAK